MKHGVERDGNKFVLYDSNPRCRSVSRITIFSFQFCLDRESLLPVSMSDVADQIDEQAAAA